MYVFLQLKCLRIRGVLPKIVKAAVLKLGELGDISRLPARLGICESLILSEFSKQFQQLSRLSMPGYKRKGEE